MMSVTWMDVDTEAGWYVALMLGTESWGNFLPQLGRNLRGDLIPEDDGEMIVTVSPEGTDGLVLEVEGGDTYRFAPMEIQEATINVSVDTQGMGIVDYAPGDVPPEYDPENLIRHAWINLDEPAVYAFNAWPDEGYVFVEWQKNGETFSESPELVTELAESADYVAVFAELGDGQNPVMNWVGEYAAGRAHALVECQGSDEARITIEWGDSAWSLGRWIMSGRLDEDTQTVEYSDCVYSYVVYTDEGELESETVEYENGVGRIVFAGSGFTWYNDQEEREPVEFEWSYAYPEEDGQNPAMNVVGEYVAGRAHALVECQGSDEARITIEWGDSAWSLARWVMSGRFDPETGTVEYADCVRTYVVYTDEGELESETVEFENGTGYIAFTNSGFTWFDDQEDRDPPVFEWFDPAEEGEG